MPREFKESVKPCVELMKTVGLEDVSSLGKKNNSRAYYLALPDNKYLEETLIGIVISGLIFLAKVRPGDPINAFAAYLIKNKPNEAMKKRSIKSSFSDYSRK
ncbi:unnamed protein product [Brassicogethes aeneus]|uniref:Uncharacterized protein n=1 Tax=Brassicogethes aeneus TaxID=1431903 RepID=A0A9P0AW66_BRAAE|nr:unnamed protein product [Brassicogethes aeneus]